VEGTTVDIVVVILSMKWVQYWDDEMIIARDAVDNFVGYYFHFHHQIPAFPSFVLSLLHCYWTHPLLHSISTTPYLFSCHFIYLID
jgi:hypothetical protein